MKPAIAFREAARLEFNAAIDWYESQREGLGLAFIAEVQRALDSIVESPQIGQVVTSDVRRRILKRFPYALFYRVQPQQIEVIAVFHASRDPQAWQRRSI